MPSVSADCEMGDCQVCPGWDEPGSGCAHACHKQDERGRPCETPGCDRTAVVNGLCASCCIAADACDLCKAPLPCRHPSCPRSFEGAT